MIVVRKAEHRGHADHGWLDTWHTFSFADYHDPAEMGWGALRVINEDRVQPGKGFDTHGHRDMEIITYVLEGALQHRDSMGNGTRIVPHEVQRMSAGRGVMHSEVNPSDRDPVHLLQIWIQPKLTGVPPSYEQKYFSPEEKRGVLRLVASGNGRDGSVQIQQDADLYASLLEAGERVGLDLEPGRLAYLHVARGNAKLNGQALGAGDGAKVSDERTLIVEANGPAELLLFDLPARKGA
jgi:hypothetical protein